MKRLHYPFILVLLVFVMLASVENASAYVGPGAGLTAIGAALAFVGAIVLAIFGFVWYPIKRLIQRLRGGRSETSGSRSETSPSKDAPDVVN